MEPNRKLFHDHLSSILHSALLCGCWFMVAGSKDSVDKRAATKPNQTKPSSPLTFIVVHPSTIGQSKNVGGGGDLYLTWTSIQVCSVSLKRMFGESRGGVQLSKSSLCLFACPKVSSFSCFLTWPQCEDFFPFPMHEPRIPFRQ